ncbi:hypothetical protein N8I74_02470 [Chitiniphilus purpureus]|uniref:RNA-binding S4 domain-containing protein n=1 Tax=Chitiniphilus purpureus TaxID=2981137 RepID=A0ABY6DNH4_9NEIS|nr:hypothetical protein [Chitiniphilus sp. CD1]UXY15901.1 hypothetical protein N8I74_02470 [Chitiniphilus sp. CD1]
MTSLLASLLALSRGNADRITVNDRVNRVAGLAGGERVDGRVLKIIGQRARVCWPQGQKTEEDLGNLVLIVE